MDYAELIERRKSQPFVCKAANSNELDESGRVVKIVANTLNFLDYDGDILLPGCANRSIANNGAKSGSPDKIAHLLHHDMTKAVGKSLLEAETEVDGNKVLYCESFLPETTDGEDTLLKYKYKIYNQHSVGMRYMDIDYIEEGATNWDKYLASVINPEDLAKRKQAWVVREIKWWEYSTVTFGANRLTQSLGLKSENKLLLADTISKKFAILANKAMRKEVKDKHVFEFELLTLQQMVYELTDNGSSDKSTQPKGPDEAESHTSVVSLSGFSKGIKF